MRVKRGTVRVVDQEVKLAPRKLGNLLLAPRDALRARDVQRNAAHAHIHHLLQHLGPARRGDDMHACPYPVSQYSSTSYIGAYLHTILRKACT